MIDTDSVLQHSVFKSYFPDSRLSLMIFSNVGRLFFDPTMNEHYVCRQEGLIEYEEADQIHNEFTVLVNTLAHDIREEERFPSFDNRFGARSASELTKAVLTSILGADKLPKEYRDGVYARHLKLYEGALEELPRAYSTVRVLIEINKAHENRNLSLEMIPFDTAVSAYIFVKYCSTYGLPEEEDFRIRMQFGTDWDTEEKFQGYEKIRKEALELRRGIDVGERLMLPYDESSSEHLQQRVFAAQNNRWEYARLRQEHLNPKAAPLIL